MKYILGGGIAGLIFAFYNNDYRIITRDIGGQFNFKFNLGPRFLRVNNYSKELLTNLNIKCNEKKVKVGYYYNNKIYNFLDNIDLKKKYFKKSRGIEFVEDKTLMNSGLIEFEAFDININKVINILKRRVRNRIINADIIKIDLDKKELILSKNKIGIEYLKFNNIISTIPKDIFYTLINKQKSFYSSSITYVLLDKIDIDFQNYDFVYFPEDKQEFHRLTKLPKNLFVAELFGIYNNEKLKKIFGESFVNKIILSNSQIIPEEGQENFNNIKFFGRYGTWDRSWKIEKCIEEAIKHDS